MKKTFLIFSGIILPITLCLGAIHMVSPRMTSMMLGNVSGYIESLKSNFFQYSKDETSYEKMASVDILAGLQPSAGEGIDEEDIVDNKTINEDVNELRAKAVLVASKKTLIMGMPDYYIKKIYVENGSRFKRGDVLVEYQCHRLKAKLDAAKSEHKLAETKKMATSRLFNLELSSGVELAQAQMQDKKARAHKVIAERSYNDCVVKAAYNGHVTKKWANNNEYMNAGDKIIEVVSSDSLSIDFKLPSKSLRWVNIGTPVNVSIDETGDTYSGAVNQIFGEVDSGNQTIQIRAKINGYTDRLLPGMSGEVILNMNDASKSGVSGYLTTALR